MEVLRYIGCEQSEGIEKKLDLKIVLIDVDILSVSYICYTRLTS